MDQESTKIHEKLISSLRNWLFGVAGPAQWIFAAKVTVIISQILVRITMRPQVVWGIPNKRLRILDRKRKSIQTAL